MRERIYFLPAMMSGPRKMATLSFHSSLSTCRSVGNNFIHKSATAMVPWPPSKHGCH
jgi:hypothetical protein